MPIILKIPHLVYSQMSTTEVSNIRDLYKLLQLCLYLMKEQQNGSDESLSKPVAEVGFELPVADFWARSQCQRSQCSDGSSRSFFSFARV